MKTSSSAFLASRKERPGSRLKAAFEKGILISEMQRQSQPFFRKRSLVCIADSHSKQHFEGNCDYAEIKPVYSLNVLDFYLNTGLGAFTRHDLFVGEMTVGCLELRKKGSNGLTPAQELWRLFFSTGVATEDAQAASKKRRAWSRPQI
jgi:hypothetical protein